LTKSWNQSVKAGALVSVIALALASQTSCYGPCNDCPPVEECEECPDPMGDIASTKQLMDLLPIGSIMPIYSVTGIATSSTGETVAWPGWYVCDGRDSRTPDLVNKSLHGSAEPGVLATDQDPRPNRAHIHDSPGQVLEIAQTSGTKRSVVPHGGGSPGPTTVWDAGSGEQHQHVVNVATVLTTKTATPSVGVFYIMKVR
jgi:hypothetical protein